MPNRSILSAAVAVAAMVHPLAAQGWHAPADSSRAGWSLERTMREFLHSLPGTPSGFFPARGEWTRVVTTRMPSARNEVSVERYRASETDSVTGPGGPACASFHSGDAAAIGTVLWPAIDAPGGWHRTAGTRFVPDGFRAASPIFVEWRREDGRWVVSSYGERGWYEPHLAGREGGGVDPRNTYPLRLPLPPEARIAADADWYVRSDPIPVAGHLLVKYGLPRRLGEGDVVRFAAYRGVGLYVEPQVTGAPPVVFVPVDREGNFQAYQNSVGTGCEK